MSDIIFYIYMHDILYMKIKEHSFCDIKTNAKPLKSYGLGFSPTPPTVEAAYFFQFNAQQFQQGRRKRRGGKQKEVEVADEREEVLNDQGEANRGSGGEEETKEV